MSAPEWCACNKLGGQVHPHRVNVSLALGSSCPAERVPWDRDEWARKHGQVLRVVCRHCGHHGPPGADHTCPCPNTDEDCEEHNQWP